MGQNALGQSDYKIFKSTISLEQNHEKASFFACWYRIMENRSWLKCIGVGMVKNGSVHSVLRTLKLAVESQKLRIVWHRLSANQIVRCFKLKKRKNYMRYQVDFLLSLKLQKISYYFGLCWKILLANQFAGFFTFDLFDLLILIPGVHCYIVPV